MNRQMLDARLLALAASLLITLVLGCPASKGPEPPVNGVSPDESAKTEEPKEEAKETETKPEETKKEEAEKKEETKPEETQPDDTSKKGESAAVSSAPVNTLLGSPELTAGLPGEGPLTIQQIQDWLDQPENMQPLDVELPLGLSAGRAEIPADNPLTRAKIELGRQLYFDRRLSADATVSCADCHHPEEGYARHTQFGVGIGGQQGNRNSPVSYNRILSAAQFWDGRAPSLEAQAVGPIANPIEMGNTHEQAVETVKNIEGYKMQFEAVFPGEGVTIDNIGKAIASFERAVVTGPSLYDYNEIVRVVRMQFVEEADLEDLKQDNPQRYQEYLAAVEKTEEMSDSAKRGRELFFGDKAGCTACHSGANFSDEKYHNLGIGMDKEPSDLGRYEQTKDDKDRGAFKTPTVRNVTRSAPYMHDGSLATLEEVVEWYDKGGHPNPHLSDKIKKLNLTESEKADLVAFMKALDGEFPAVQTARLPGN